MPRLFALKKYSVGEHRESLVSSESLDLELVAERLNVEDCGTLWTSASSIRLSSSSKSVESFHIVPLFFTELLTVPGISLELLFRMLLNADLAEDRG